MLRFWTLLVIGLACFGSVSADQPSACILDREGTLSLDYGAFDQDPQLGWRSIDNRPECRLDKANLIREYHERLQARGEPVVWDTAQGSVTLSDTGEVRILYWHEGQLRAFAGQTAEAATLFHKSLQPAGQNYGAWNQYVLGSIAFLDGDLQELERNAGILQEYDPDSLNLRVLQRMIHCFGTTYAHAYVSEACVPTVTAFPDDAQPADRCIDDPNALLRLDYEAFENDTSGRGGWRGIADKEGCEEVAADLIKTYRETRTAKQLRRLMHHEAQLRGTVGDYGEAISLLQQILETEPDLSMRYYREAELGFFRRDKSALKAARASLAGVPKPEGFDAGVAKFKEKYPELSPPIWPVNLDVVDGLLNCFDRPYAQAYSTDCRSN